MVLGSKINFNFNICYNDHIIISDVENCIQIDLVQMNWIYIIIDKYELIFISLMKFVCKPFSENFFGEFI